jgi:hypothetical protein
MRWAFVAFCAVSSSFAWAPAGSAFGQDKPAKETEVKSDPVELELAEGRIVIVKPESWKTVQPKSNMIQYEFRAPAKGDATSRITMMSASGGIEENIKRWIGQFDGLKKEDAKIEKKEVDKTIAHIVELEGTYKESMGGPFAPNAGTKKLADHAMLGAILELKDGTTVFIKMTGPKEIVAEERDAFREMVSTLKNK